MLAGLAGCTSAPRTPAAPTADGVGRDEATGQILGPADWQARLQDAQVLLLGEQHDQPAHHAARGRWLAQMPGAVVVAEHLPQGARVRWPEGGPATPAAVEAALREAGFEPQRWGWPLHAPLFEALAAAGRPVWGGNAPADTVRRVAREGASALPPAVADGLRRAALTPAAQTSLDEALQEGHCGMLPAQRLPGLREAQRLRDAAMGQSLLDALDAGARPAVLVAGNGHVRRDWGVAQWLVAQRPGLRVLSVQLDVRAPTDVPPRPDADPAAVTDLRWWSIAPLAPGDPCEGLRPAR